MAKTERVLKWLYLMSATDRLVKVKSWVPWWDGRYLCWPTILKDSLWGTRSTSSPCWDRLRVCQLLTRTGAY